MRLLAQGLRGLLLPQVMTVAKSLGFLCFHSTGTLQLAADVGCCAPWGGGPLLVGHEAGGQVLSLLLLNGAVSAWGSW